MGEVTTADRKRLTAILGMLGSNQPGERDNAARLAEQFRIQHGLTWADLLAMPPEPVKPPPQPEPAKPASPPPPPPTATDDGPPYPIFTPGLDWKKAAYPAYPIGIMVVLYFIFGTR